MPTQKLSEEILAAALEGYEARKARIDAKIAEVRAMLGGRSTGTGGSSEGASPKRTVSASVRRRMARAQKLRWKKFKQSAAPAQAETVKPKREQSARGRKRVAPKKRGAAIKKQAEPQPAAAKKASQKKTAAAPAQSVPVA
jgi:hypothetical protein